MIELLPLVNTPEVFGLHTNAEIGYFTRAAKDVWAQLVELQPQTGEAGTGISREEFIGGIASDIQVGASYARIETLTHSNKQGTPFELICDTAVCTTLAFYSKAHWVSGWLIRPQSPSSKRRWSI